MTTDLGPTFDEILALVEGETPMEVVGRLRELLNRAGFPPVAVRSAVPGEKRSGKACVLDNWQTDAREAEPAASKWAAEPFAVNTGIALHGLRAVDIDVDDEGRARACREAVERICGPSPAVRVREGTGRLALLYRAATGEPGKKARKNTSADKAIEVLGAGQQLVAFGRHWAGGDIRWAGTPGLEVERADLPAVTENQIDDVLDQCGAIIGADPPREERVTSFTETAPPGGWKGMGERTPGGGDHDPLTEADVRACLDAIPNNGGRASYDEWLRLGMAVYAATGGSPAGLDAWTGWSGAGDAGECWWQWRGFARSGVRSVTAGTLVWWARQHRPDLALTLRQGADKKKLRRAMAALAARKHRT